MTRRAAQLAAVVPALLLTGWLIAGLPLLLAGALHPAVTVVLAMTITLPVVVLVHRLRPASTAALPVLLTLAVAAGFAAIAWTTSSEHVVVRRDPGVYAQTADWLAHKGKLPIRADADVFARTPGLRYGSSGFYQRDQARHVVPQFMS